MFQNRHTTARARQALGCLLLALAACTVRAQTVAIFSAGSLRGVVSELATEARASFGIYTTHAEIDALADGLTRVREFFA